MFLYYETHISGGIGHICRNPFTGVCFYNIKCTFAIISATLLNSPLQMKERNHTQDAVHHRLMKLSGAAELELKTPQRETKWHNVPGAIKLLSGKAVNRVGLGIYPVEPRKCIQLADRVPCHADNGVSSHAGRTAFNKACERSIVVDEMYP